MDKHKIDSHKLIYHVERVDRWLKGDDIYPIYVEISPAGACNHRCTYCAMDYMSYQTRYLDTELIKSRLTEMGKLGVKSVMYAGEGEPLIHKDIVEIINHTKASGIDVAVTSNGVCLTEKITKGCLKDITWIKISFDAATPETYAEIHQTEGKDFDTVIKNLRFAVEYRKEHNLSTTIGMQLILIPENREEVVKLAELAKDIGVDYLVVKSYSQHLSSHTTKYKDIDYRSDYKIAEELKTFSGENFNAIFRMNAMEKLEDTAHSYQRCNALPFWSYIDAGANLWGCSAFLEDERFSYGSLLDNTFEEIWKGERRRECMEYVKEELDLTECRRNCRMDEINRYLWELKHPGGHVNFI